MNKLETELSQNDLNCLFSQKVEKVDNNHFYIRTKTHQICIKNPKITWDKPYTEPKQTKIELVDTTETFIGATSLTRTELFFHGVASIENFPDLALFDSVILNSPIIEPIELLKNQMKTKSWVVKTASSHKSNTARESTPTDHWVFPC